ncbi:cytochrome P450 [Streptomyces chrestomyceticus]|uniref:cytochrome P450 family protein n=1 Tax=Streptomyces chrestomyceticus TaxID=68185 RepID=UPI0033C62090
MDLSPAIPATAGQPLSLKRPVLQLDPASPDMHRDAARMRAAGSLVPVTLPGDVVCWAVTRNASARIIQSDPDTFSADRAHWRALNNGEVPQDWSLRGLAVPRRSLVTVDGIDHRRLRKPLANAFTARRVEGLRTYIEATTARLLNVLAATAADAGGVVDFRKTLAWPLPMTVISHLLGVPQRDHDDLHRWCQVIFDDTQDPADALVTFHDYLTGLVALRRRDPQDDLISALLSLPDDQQLTDEELVPTVQVLVIAGHETTVHLLVNGVRALCGHPQQLELLLRGEVSWETAVEEILRWQPPTANFLARFATRDVTVDGVRIAAGDMVMLSYIAMGRDEERYGPDADRFDIRRVPRSHLSFGYGTHRCPGERLARLEGALALNALFKRYPGLTLADPPPRSPSVLMNSYPRLPVRLTPSADRPTADIPAEV